MTSTFRPKDRGKTSGDVERTERDAVDLTFIPPRQTQDKRRIVKSTDADVLARISLDEKVLTSLSTEALAAQIPIALIIWSMVRDGSAQPASPTIFAGTPATVTLFGTGFTTTEPAAMRAQ